jgi:phosphoribosylformylglycinamidine synthase subunit PurQ / glutaminase
MKKKAQKKRRIRSPRVLVLSGYGLNCEEETKFAFEWAGEKNKVIADIVHINDLIAEPEMLSKYQILVFPGGFSYGDDTGSGKAFANKFKNHLAGPLEEFLARDTLTLGICNGFQIMTNLGILPGALTYNKNSRYIDRWVDLEVVGTSPWLGGIKTISLPIAHGEGRYTVPEAEYRKMKKAGRVRPNAPGGRVVLTYIKGEVCKFQNPEKNPNGSLHDIAGVTSHGGRVLGLMPHPERGMFAHQSPMWHNGMKKEKEGQGLMIFRNAINYFGNKQ